MDCPKCVGKLQRTTVSSFQTSQAEELKGAGLKFQLELDQCFVCRGVWFDKSELDKYLSEAMTRVDSPSVGTALDRSLDARAGKCPRCHVDLVKQRAPQTVDMMVDVCEQCRGIWLDSTEIDRFERSGHGKPSVFEVIVRAIIQRKKP